MMTERAAETVICDPLCSYGELLAHVLDRRPEFTVKLSSTSADLLQTSISQESSNTLIISEVRFPETDIFSIYQNCGQTTPNGRWVVFTAEVGPILLEHLRKLPLAGIILKTEPLDRIIQALLTVVNSGTYHSPEIRSLIENRPTASTTRIDKEHPARSLTEHQLDILKRLARGFSVKEIAAQMHLSPKSIDSHKYRIMQKLGIHDRVHLTRFAIRENLIDP